jgi:hypothetical protein
MTEALHEVLFQDVFGAPSNPSLKRCFALRVFEATATWIKEK